MKINYYLLVILCFCIATVAQADDPVQSACSDGGEMRLDAPGKSMEGLPVLDQSTGNGNEAGGLCYSYVASQMIDSWQQKNGTRTAGRISSPFHIAFNSAADRNRTKYNGGDPCQAIESTVKSGGTCDHEHQFLATDRFNTRSFLYSLEEAWKSFQWQRDFTPYLRDEFRTPDLLARDLERRARENACSLAQPYMFAATNVAMFEATFKVLKKLYKDNQYFDADENDEEARGHDKMSFMRDFANQMCLPKNSPITPKLAPATPHRARCVASNYGPNQQQAFQLDLLNKLKTNEMPVGVGYCSFLLQDSRRTHSPAGSHSVLRYGTDADHTPECQFPTRGPDGNLAYTYRKSYHISMIMGKRWQNGKCQVLLRNTWGADACSAYSAAGLTDCQNGQLWIDLNELANNSFAIRNIE